MAKDGMLYNGGNGDMTPQLRDYYWLRKAIIDNEKEKFFTQLADTINMPKHYGQTIKCYHYIPLLDDRNINDQGIDATGSDTANEVTITMADPAGMKRYAVGDGDDAAAALSAAKTKAEDMWKNLGIFNTDYATTKAALEAAGWTITEGDAVNVAGNLYGSSRDIGTITSRMPTLSETGGRVNRVGFKRETLEARIYNFGIFEEYTRDFMNFDSDDQLMAHLSRETMRGANKLYEDKLQIDLINNANVVMYGGTATSLDTVTGETTAANKSELTYDLLMRLDMMLNNNQCPRDTTIITGSRMIDTKTIPAARYVYIGPELKLTLLKMVDYHGNPAFVPTHQYGAATTIANGEIGAVGHFRFIENPEMTYWEGAGAAVTNNAGYMESKGHYNVYPVLFVGDKSFTTISFQDGGSSKFEIIHKRPGKETADHFDPYGKKGRFSLQFWYGFMAFRPEWIACAKVVAPR